MSLKFTYRCLICKEEFKIRKRHYEHLMKKHTKEEIAKKGAEWGYYSE